MMLFAFGCVAAEGLGELECLKIGPYLELMDDGTKHRLFFLSYINHHPNPGTGQFQVQM
jgi:hypothetical protein